MSSNTIVGLTSPSGADEAVNIQYYDKKFISNEIFDQIQNIAEKMEKIGNKFLNLKYDEDKDKLFSDIGYCFRGLAFDLSCIKNDLKK